MYCMIAGELGPCCAMVEHLGKTRFEHWMVVVEVRFGTLPNRLLASVDEYSHFGLYQWSKEMFTGHPVGVTSLGYV